MAPTLEQLGIDDLSGPERLELIGLIWDSITDSDSVPPVPDWHRREVAKRIASADAHPESAIPWEEVRARLSDR